MKLMGIVFAAAVLMIAAVSNEAEARPRGYFSYSGPGVGIYIGPRPRYRYYGYRPYRPYRPYRRAYRGRGCGYWSDRCAQNWGYGGPNYRGCLNYHGC